MRQGLAVFLVVGQMLGAEADACTRSFAAEVAAPASAAEGAAGVEYFETSRNGRSTPPQFVLPSSPAIAYPDFDKPAKTDVDAVLRAKAILTALGYDAGRLDENVSARFKAALFQYQRAHGLTPSGELDGETFDELGRSIK